MTNIYWTEKRVTVTGGSGFLGSFVVEKLQARGANVFVPRSADYDLTDPEAAAQMISDAQPEILIHLAALAGGIGANRERPAEFFYENLMMGVPLFHHAWEAKVPKFVAIGSICSYPKFTPLPFKEENLWEGYPEETNAPYGLAKKMLLVQAQAYREQYGYNAIYLMPVNLYGPRDNFDLQTSHVIPALIRKCIEARERGDEEIVAWGDGSPTREFLYAPDAADGIIAAAEKYDGIEPVNLGSGQEISRLTGFEGRITWDTSKPNGQPRRALDTRRAAEWFGWRAQTPFEEGLRETIAWYRENHQDIA